jgi:hypothetical protein
MKISHKLKLLPRFPNGCDSLCLAGDLQPGEMEALQFAGKEILLFRTKSGEVSALDPWTP